MSKIDPDQKKKITDRRVIEQSLNGLLLEIVTFDVRGQVAYGGRVFSDAGSSITEWLYTSRDEAIEAARNLWCPVKDAEKEA